MLISDVVILSSNTTFSELEQEKNLPNGAIFRQCLRLKFIYSVRNCLENRRNNLNHRNSLDSGLSVTFAMDQKGLAKDPMEAPLELQLAAHKISVKNRQNGKIASNGIRQQSDCLLQNIDIYRLKELKTLNKNVSRKLFKLREKLNRLN